MGSSAIKLLSCHCIGAIPLPLLPFSGERLGLGLDMKICFMVET